MSSSKPDKLSRNDLHRISNQSNLMLHSKENQVNRTSMFTDEYNRFKMNVFNNFQHPSSSYSNSALLEGGMASNRHTIEEAIPSHRNGKGRASSARNKMSAQIELQRHGNSMRTINNS